METGVAVICVFVLALIAVWNVSKKIVRFGFFILYCLIGAGLVTAGAIVATGKPLPWQAVLVSAVVFAFIVRSIRGRIARVVTVMTVLGVVQLGTVIMRTPIHDKSETDKKVTKPNTVKGHPGKPVKHDR